MDTNVINETQILSLQAEVKEKLQVVARNKRLKNADLAKMLGKSESTISEILNDKRPFSSRLLNEISGSLNDFFIHKEGVIPELRQYRYISNVVRSCKKERDFRLLTGDTAVGKSLALREFYRNNQAVWYYKIDRPMSWRVFLRKLCGALGISIADKNQYDLYDAIEQFFKERQSLNPVLIIDEMERFPLAMWLRFKDLFTTHEGMIGLLLCSIPEHKNRLARKAGLDPESWYPVRDHSNTYTTMARRLQVFNVPRIAADDVMTFFRARGVKDSEVLLEASGRVWNYDQADKLLEKAIRIGFRLETLSLQEFLAVKIH